MCASPSDRQSVAGGSHLSRIVDRASASLPFPLSLCLTHMTGQSTFYVLLIRSEHTVTLSPPPPGLGGGHATWGPCPSVLLTRTGTASTRFYFAVSVARTVLVRRCGGEWVRHLPTYSTAHDCAYG